MDFVRKTQAGINAQSAVFALLVFVVLTYGLRYFLLSYFPGQEDASLIVESMSLDWEYWQGTGYYEWFNVHPAESPVYDYEIRPLTHFMTYLLHGVGGDHWWVFPAFNILVATVFAFFAARLAFSSGRHWFVSAFGLILMVALNPSNNIEFFVDFSFFQVLLCSTVFLLLREQWIKGRYFVAAGLCILAVCLKESAWFYPGFFVMLILEHYYTSRQPPSSRMLASCLCAVIISAAVFLYMHPGNLLSDDVSVFSIGMYDDGLYKTVLNGLSRLPHFVNNEWGLVLTLVFLAFMGYAWRESRESRLALCFVLPSMVAGIIFHEELRWTHELTLSWIAFLLTLRGDVYRSLWIVTIIGWSVSSIPRLSHEISATRNYAYYTTDYQKPFKTAHLLTKEANERGIDTLLVVNDPLRMNGDYFSVLAGNRVNWVTLNSIDYPHDASAPDEYPFLADDGFVVGDAGSFAFMGFKGKNSDKWMPQKEYGEDRSVIDHFLPGGGSGKDFGVVDFVRDGSDVVISPRNPVDDSVAYAYFWRDSKDAWLFFRDGGADRIAMVSPYATFDGSGYQVDLPIIDCEKFKIEIQTGPSKGVRQEGCRVTGHLAAGDFLSVSLVQDGHVQWGYVMRTPPGLSAE